MAILYVETSLPMSAAMGRDPDALRLLQNFPPRHTLAVPAACLMESLSAHQRERSNYYDVANRLRQQANQLLRDRSSAAAAAMMARLREAAIEADRLQNDIQSRLVAVLDELTRRATVIPTDPFMFAASLQAQHLRQMTDNLILHTILAHAAADTAGQPKALLSGNTNDFNDPQIRALLSGAGIAELWSTAADAEAWLDGLS